MNTSRLNSKALGLACIASLAAPTAVALDLDLAVAERTEVIRRSQEHGVISGCGVCFCHTHARAGRAARDMCTGFRMKARRFRMEYLAFCQGP